MRPRVGRVGAHSEPERGRVPCAKEERAGGRAEVGEMRGLEKEGKGSFLPAENPGATFL